MVPRYLEYFEIKQLGMIALQKLLAVDTLHIFNDLLELLVLKYNIGV